MNGWTYLLIVSESLIFAFAFIVYLCFKNESKKK